MHMQKIFSPSLLGRGNVIFRFSRRIPALYCVRVVLNVQITSAVSPLTSPQQVVEPPPFAKAFAPATPLTLNPSIGRSIFTVDFQNHSTSWSSPYCLSYIPQHDQYGTTINVRHTQRPPPGITARKPFGQIFSSWVNSPIRFYSLLSPGWQSCMSLATKVRQQNCMVRHSFKSSMPTIRTTNKPTNKLHCDSA